MTVYNPQSSSIMVWDACTHLSWHRGCLLCRCKGTGATQGRRRASGTAKWRERRWWPEEKATFHRCPSSPWTQCGILTGECGFYHYCFNIENIEQPIHCDQELLNCQEFIQLFIDTWHYHDSEEFNLTKNEILDPSISEYLGGKGISNQAGSTAPSRSHIGVIFYCLFENTSYLMPTIWPIIFPKAINMEPVRVRKPLSFFGELSPKYMRCTLKPRPARRTRKKEEWGN